MMGSGIRGGDPQPLHQARTETLERVECGGELRASRSCLLGSSEPSAACEFDARRYFCL
jgi:hypothetical protein